MHLPGIRWSPIPDKYLSLFSTKNLIQKNGKYYSRARIILGKEILPPDGRHWALSQESIFELEKSKKIKLGKNGEPQTEESEMQKLTDNWTDWVGYSSTWGFTTENHEKVIERAIRTSSPNVAEIVLDFFLGSGTTTAVAQKLGKKWIGVEMGGHFWTVVLPRMKEVLAGKGIHEPTGISTEIKWKGGGFFKYQTLEQYEDTLDNIKLKENKQAESLFKDEYLLKYFLEFETQESPYLLNIEHLKDPFSYRLKVNLDEVGEPQEMVTDLPETFNYLLGLKVKKVKTRTLQCHPELVSGSKKSTKEMLNQVQHDKNNQRKYLFILGGKDGINTSIIWRNFNDKWDENDYKKDRDFIINELKAWMPHRVYINGQSVLTTNLEGHTIELYYIEPEFKNLMEG
jgi:adenine-specific DNA-methyltransferase